nr:uncharacterized protein LOC117228427 [Megalopta genalis]
MIAMCDVWFKLPKITGCVAPLCQRPSSNDHNSNGKSVESKSTEGESRKESRKTSQAKNPLSNDTSDTCDRNRNSNNPNDAKEKRQVVQQTKPVSSEKAQISPAIPTLNQSRISGKNHLENITNAPPSVCDGSVRVVQADIEVHPEMHLSRNQESLDSTKYVSFQADQNCLNVEKAKKRASFLKKLNFKRIKTCTRSKTSIPAAQSTMLQDGKAVNASSSNRISANILETKSQDVGASAKETGLNGNGESREENCERRPSKTLQEIVPLINNRPAGEKLMCNIRINGLAMNQTDLDLLESTEGKTRSVSMTTTEETFVISIEFDRRRNFKENKPQKQTRTPNVVIPPIYVTDYSTKRSFAQHS